MRDCGGGDARCAPAPASAQVLFSGRCLVADFCVTAARTPPRTRRPPRPAAPRGRAQHQQPRARTVCTYLSSLWRLRVGRRLARRVKSALAPAGQRPPARLPAHGPHPRLRLHGGAPPPHRLRVPRARPPLGPALRSHHRRGPRALPQGRLPRRAAPQEQPGRAAPGRVLRGRGLRRGPPPPLPRQARLRQETRPRWHQVPASSTRGATSRTTSRRSAWRRSTRTPRTSPTASSASSSARWPRAAPLSEHPTTPTP